MLAQNFAADIAGYIVGVCGDLLDINGGLGNESGALSALIYTLKKLLDLRYLGARIA